MPPRAGARPAWWKCLTVPRLSGCVVPSRLSHVNGQPRLVVAMLAILGCAILGSCTGSGTSKARVGGPVGSQGDPLVLSCAQESFLPYPSSVPRHPGPADLAVGPLFIINGKRQASASSGDLGSYPKIPFVVVPGSVVTVTIGAQARAHVGIDNPYARAWGVGLVTAATYRPCSGQMGFFAQGFTFSRGQIRGCVPLSVQIDHERLVRHVTISLGAGACAGHAGVSA
jgi:hypothetical protein